MSARRKLLTRAGGFLGGRAHRLGRRWDRLAVTRGLDRAARRVGYRVLADDYYSPLVDTARLHPTVWEDPSPMPGLELDYPTQLALVEERLTPHLPEFDPPRHPPGDRWGFYLDNPFYGAVDAELLYAMVRHLRPGRVLELGSGFSTLVIERAGERNAAEAAPFVHEVIDPYPAPQLGRLGQQVRVSAQPATDVPFERFESLAPGDLLFVDTTHTVKPGGEVVRLVLQILPALAPGVTVHIHDIFRPFEYPRVLYDRFGMHWQEHHLVQAFLAFNPRFEVLLATHALCRLHGERLRRSVPSLQTGLQPSRFSPSGFWLRSRDT